MATGRVKWFNNSKGFGFLLAEDASKEYFVHYSSIVVEGYKTLKAGEAVRFEVVEGPKGPHAVNVEPIHIENDQTKETSPKEG